MQKIKIGIIQMKSIPDFVQNMSFAVQEIQKTAKQGARWVILPELFSFYGAPEKISYVAETDDGLFLKQLRELAKKLNIYLFAGSIYEKSSIENKFYNTAYVLSPQGEIFAKYRKIHLFSLRDDAGIKTHDESLYFLRGNKPCALTIDGWRIGLSICYDLRFPQIFETLTRDQELDAFILPAAFTYQTGKDHWQTLTRARAIDYQCFFIGCNQTGQHTPEKRSFGHSLVYSPWGELLYCAEEKTGSEVIELDKESIKTTKSRLNLFLDRLSF